jgi:hypothetical protein
MIKMRLVASSVHGIQASSRKGRNEGVAGEKHDPRLLNVEGSSASGSERDGT